MEDNEPSKVGFERRLSALESVLEKISNVVDNVLKENRDRETRLLRKMDSVFVAINGLAESLDGIQNSCSCRKTIECVVSGSESSAMKKSKTKKNRSRLCLTNFSSNLVGSHLLVIGQTKPRCPRNRHPVPHLQVRVKVIPILNTATT